MPTTVYFATNRVVENAADPRNGYRPDMVPPLRPNALTYGMATVDDIDIATNAQGNVTDIRDVVSGDFSAQAKADLANPHRDLLIFVHGFDNSFSDAITRAAFNREWLAASRLPGADTTVVAFSWPSLGKLIGIPIPSSDYRSDQLMARNSGAALMTFLSRLQPVLAQARARGNRSTLLAHSMGALALEAAMENWFLNGNGAGTIFDLAILAAGDSDHTTFDQPQDAGMQGLTQLATRTSIFYSRSDHVLQLSMFLNGGAKRLGQDGPHNRADPTEFPATRFIMNDCSAVDDYDVTFMASHQYYRISPTVRRMIASQMAPVAVPVATATAMTGV